MRSRLAPHSLATTLLASTLLMWMIACTAVPGADQTTRPSERPSSSAGTTSSVVPRTAGRRLPPAYLAWTTGGFVSGLGPKLSSLPSVQRAVVVAGDTLWMEVTFDSTGHRVDAPRGPYRIPLETFAVEPGAMAPFLPPAYRDQVTGALKRGQGVLGATSSTLRRLGVGGRLRFGAGVVTIGAVVPDAAVSWSELLISRRLGARLGVTHDRFALLAYEGTPSVEEVASSMRSLLPTGTPLRVRAPGTATYRRHADSVWPQVLMKAGFGEFAARPDPTDPAFLDVDPSWVRAHISTRSVPLLGMVTCNVELFHALDAAMRELQRAGLGTLVRSFGGCYVPRTIERVPTAPLSHHSWGAAVDINAPQNPYGAKPVQDPRLVAIMRAHGFTWGGRWTVPDGMHFEFVEPTHELPQPAASG
jgi:D-alanyl-D-alanine carboxypeptidase-like protein